LSVNLTIFPIFWLNFTKNLTPIFLKKTMEGFHLHKQCCLKLIFINYIPLFDVYDLLLEHFIFKHGHMDLLACQNISKEIVWGHEMMGYMLLFIVMHP
jgi:hypothetical protein